MQKVKRYLVFDYWRGLAILAMVAFHVVFILNYYVISNIDYRYGAVALIGHFARHSFLLLVGISLFLSFSKSPNYTQFSRKQARRFGVIAVAALLVNLATFLTYGDHFIRFGILHLIATAVLVGAFLVRAPHFSLILAVLILIFTQSVENIQGGESFLAYVFGLNTPGVALDYFPIFPNLGVPLIGIFLGKVLGNKQAALSHEFWKKLPLQGVIAFLGRHALLIYLVHVPFILGFLMLLGALK